ncbi:hypothetical protein E2562_013744 [Oryza meyeriana var. granulata]|uniref:Uncharacterized protein n=1 Tax=Oryza meyeriana var. granulata TaxID=110450 RepID=A0A6G1BKH7_9ORYZ|nr:hypothetical protein E2562_013744 [Oryza meyeriana var. granulata]
MTRPCEGVSPRDSGDHGEWVQWLGSTIGSKDGGRWREAVGGGERKGEGRGDDHDGIGLREERDTGEHPEGINAMGSTVGSPAKGIYGGDGVRDPVDGAEESSKVLERV